MASAVRVASAARARNVCLGRAVASAFAALALQLRSSKFTGARNPCIMEALLAKVAAMHGVKLNVPLQASP